MEISNQGGEIPIPLNSTYIGGGVHGHGPHGHLIHHHHDPPPLNHIIPSTTPPQVPLNGTSMPNNSLEIEQASSSSYKKLVKYKECLKNHAASMGGNATDGCGEFMPSGEEGTIEALTCSACNCHRNFHRKEIEGEQPCSFDTWPHLNRSMQGRKLILGHHHKNVLTGTTTEALGYPTATSSFIPSRSAPHPHHMIMSYNMGSQLPSESDEQEDGSGGVGLNRPPQLMKKRFRTKFTQEQKEKMFNFAEKIGWKIQKQEDSVVQQFCQEIGVKRRVLKVWMHNNKHNLAKKNALLSA